MENQKILTGVVVIAVIGILTAGVLWYTNSENKGATPEQQNTQAEQVDRSMAEVVEFAMYADGQYEAIGQYTSPGGGETIDVSVSIADNIITDVVVTPNARLPISVKFQNQFKDGIASEVIGKNINEVELDVVSGSSLTPIGFKNALEQIKTQAGVVVAEETEVDQNSEMVE